MKIFQPTISGSFSSEGSVFLKGLSSVAQSNVLLIDTTSGQLYYTASAAIGGTTIDTGSLVTTASFNAYTGSNASQFAGTASYTILSETTITAQTASYSTTFTVGSKLIVDQTLTDFATVASTIVGSNNLFSQITGSYTAAFGKYTLYKGTNARSGEFWTVWNDSLPTSYTDTSVADIGNTADIVFSTVLVGSDIQINAVAASSGWTIKMLTTFI